ncbi:vp1054 [Spodoptera litura granulovirus]|uniref:Vp1054 n=1 Tax=Spodoptera litura granulovirus TaxID=359919 RepID=A5IZY2_9BBAC|nr:vp1054 [Spodoptera litura granulovirus]ABQ52073.1 vp1054 [Spodoptera litura granulovirus]
MTTTARYEQPVTERSTHYQPLIIARTKCRFHPNRPNCRTVKTLLLDRAMYEHYTCIPVYYCNTSAEPYYQFNEEQPVEIVTYRNLIDGQTLICGQRFFENHHERLYSVCEAGERDVQLIKMVLKTAYNFLYNKRNTCFILMRYLYVDCLYSNQKCIILPQEMYAIYKESEEPAMSTVIRHFVIPDYDEAEVSQDVYKTFIVYNTVLTMMLKEKNPFNDTTKTISKIVESVGTCNGGIEGGKRAFIKVCELKFGGSTPPDHVMCPPKDMVLRVFRYARWAQRPNKYKQYIDLIVRDVKKENMTLEQWQAFQINFRRYFFPE